MLLKKMRALPLTLAAVMACSVIPVHAEDIDLSNPDSQTNVRVNKPYLNFTVDTEEGVDISKVRFALQNSKGETVATFKGGNDRFSTVGEHMFDFSFYRSREDLSEFPYNYDRYNDAFNLFYPDPKKGLKPSGEVYDSQGHSVVAFDSGYLTFAEDYYYYYNDRKKFNIVDTKTVPANTFVVEVSKSYSTNNDKKTNFSLYPISSDTLESDYDYNSRTTFNVYEHPGETLMFYADPGKYQVCASGSRAGAYTCEAYSEPTTYVKVKMKFKDAFPNIGNDDLIIEKDHYGETYYFDLRGDQSEYTFSAIYHSGAMITAAIPDENGDVEFWVSDQTLTTYMAYSYSWPYGGGGGSVATAKLPKSVEKINVLLDLPESGYCLYNLPADKYTLVIDDPEFSKNYMVYDATVSTNNNKRMQKAAFTVGKKRLLLGDCSFDQKIDSADVILLAAYVKGLGELDEIGILAGDVNEDGVIDAADVVLLAAHVKGTRTLPVKYIDY